jgi:mannosyltransferase
MKPDRPPALLFALRWNAALVGLALVAIVLVPADTLVQFMAHPVRTAANDGQVVDATRRGATLLRELAPFAGLALASLALLADRALVGPAQAARWKPTRVDAMALVVAMLAAAAIRAPILAHSLWYDEIAAFMGYGVHGPGVAIGNYYTQANHGLQSVLSWVTASALGPSEFSLRLPSFLAGIATVPAVWWLARECSSAMVARAAAFAAALMPIAVLASTEARGYALMALFATLATASLLWARRVRHPGAWALYAIVCALGAWSHLVTLCVPLSHAIWCAVAFARARNAPDRRGARAGLLVLVVAVLLTAALYAPVIPDMLAIRGEFTAADGNEPTLLSTHGAQMALMLGGSWTWWASLAALPLLVAGIAAARADESLRRALVLAFGGALLALLAPIALHSWLYARFLTFLVPGIALLMGAGAAWLLARTPTARVGLLARARGAPLAAACAAIAAIGWVASVQSLPPRQPIREGVAYIAEHRAPNDRALAIGLPDDVHAIYADGFGVPIEGTGPYGRDLAAMLPAVQPRWVLMLYPRAMPVQVHETLRAAGFEPVARLDGWIDDGDGQVVVLERRAR